MSKLLHTKAERTKLLKTFPNNRDGKDGDIVLCSISGKGIYICAKIDGRWFAANKMQDLKKLEKTSIRDLKVDKLRVGNATLTKDEYDKPVGDFTLDVAGDIVLNADGGQVTIKDDSASHFLFDCDGSQLVIYDDTDSADLFRIRVGASGATTITTIDDGSIVGHLTLIPDGDLVLDPASKQIIINTTDRLCFDGGGDTYISETIADVLLFTVGGVAMLRLKEGGGGISDRVSILSETGLYFDGGGIAADTYIYEAAADILRIVVGGESLLQLSEAGGGTSDKVAIPATTGLYLDGGGNTYIYEQAADVLRVVVGGDVIMHISEKGDDGNEVHFGSSCVGFTQIEPTYDATTTVVDFRHSNKQFVTFDGGDITNLQLFFPLVSGNFVLLVKQDGTGSRTITNYKAMEFDESAADGAAAVKFAGGSKPTLTTDANHVDILSFYWDADNEIAYGVATLDFQF